MLVCRTVFLPPDRGSHGSVLKCPVLLSLAFFSEFWMLLQVRISGIFFCCEIVGKLRYADPVLFHKTLLVPSPIAGHP